MKFKQATKEWGMKQLFAFKDHPARWRTTLRHQHLKFFLCAALPGVHRPFNHLTPYADLSTRTHDNSRSVVPIRQRWPGDNQTPTLKFRSPWTQTQILLRYPTMHFMSYNGATRTSLIMVQWTVTAITGPPAWMCPYLQPTVSAEHKILHP
jgi:hypothetical protein